jgi:hypothetical protein
MNRNQAFAAGATAVVLLAIAFGIQEAGSPGLQRLANTDEARVTDLNAISRAVSGHYTAYKNLPQNLADFNAPYPLRRNDPDTGKLYEYRPLDDRRFELCAVFSTDNRSETLSPLRNRPHGAGRQCFSYP